MGHGCLSGTLLRVAVSLTVSSEVVEMSQLSLKRRREKTLASQPRHVTRSGQRLLLELLELLELLFRPFST
jgi:hypothetical protein